MKTNNPFIDNMIEAQTSAVNSFMDTTKKFQSAFASGNIASEGQNIYKEWMEKQTGMFGGMPNMGNPFAAGENKAEEFFKNWYTQQMNSIKQMVDFNQGIYSNVVNYGKSANDYANSYTSMNNAWTNIYNSWMQTLNTSYDTFSKNINNPFNKDMFKNMFEGSQAMMSAQQMFQPMIKAMQSGDFSMDTWKNVYNADNYKRMTEQMFSGYFNNANMKDMYDNAMKQVQHFFADQNNLGKEYITQMQNMSTQFPNMFSGNIDKMKDLNNVFGKTFEPLLKLVSPGKEKENVEETIALMDKVAEYSIKQSEMQYHLYKTMQASMEKLAEQTKEKYKDVQKGNIPGANDLYNDFVKINEQMFAELFASEEFSKVKGETLNIGMDVKKHFEKQFETVFGQYPVVFRSEIEELYKTIYDLRKNIKDLQTKMAVNHASSVEIFDEEKGPKAKKK